MYIISLETGIIIVYYLFCQKTAAVELCLSIALPGARTVFHPGTAASKLEEKKVKKAIALCLSLVLILCVLAGCQTAEKEKSYANILEKVKGTGELHVSLSPDFAPMEFVDTSKSGQDQYVGFDVTLAKKIAEELGVKLVIEPMSFEACQASVSTKSVDLSISGYSYLPERAENFELSDGYYTNNESNQVIVMLADNAAKCTDASSFDGKVLSAQNASLQWNLLTEQLPNANANLVTDLGVAILEVINGQVDGLCCALGQAEIFCATYPELAKCPWEFEIDDDANVILIPKGETELLAAVNEILADCYASGVYTEWYDAANELAMSEFAQEVSIEDEPAS